MMTAAPWRTITLGDLARVVGGGTPSTRVRRFWGGPIPWFTPAEIPESGAGLVTTSLRSITDEGLASSAAKKLPTGSVLVTSRASIGNCAIAGRPMATNQGFTSLVPKDTRSTQFLYYWVQQNRPSLLSRAAGSTFLEISAGKVAAIELAAPNLDEQARIGSVLQDIDDLIAAFERLIAKKQAIKQGMMQQLLSGKSRLPGFTEPWRSRALGTILLFQVGYPFSSSGFSTVPEGPRLIRNRDLKANDAVVYFARPFPGGFTVNDGDVLIGMDGDFTPCRWRQGKALLNQRVGRLVGQNGCCTEYLFYALRAPLKAIEAETGATTVKHLSHTDVERIELTLPGQEEQQAIARVLAEVDDELEAIHRRMTKSSALKQGMMQELLTGRIRLPVKEPAA